MIMSRLHPVARVLIAVLKDRGEDAQAAGNREGWDVRVPPEP